MLAVSESTRIPAAVPWSAPASSRRITGQCIGQQETSMFDTYQLKQLYDTVPRNWELLSLRARPFLLLYSPTSTNYEGCGLLRKFCRKFGLQVRLAVQAFEALSFLFWLKTAAQLGGYWVCKTRLCKVTCLSPDTAKYSIGVPRAHMADILITSFTKYDATRNGEATSSEDQQRL